MPRIPRRWRRSSGPPPQEPHGAGAPPAEAAPPQPAPADESRPADTAAPPPEHERPAGEPATAALWSGGEAPTAGAAADAGASSVVNTGAPPVERRGAGGTTGGQRPAAHERRRATDGPTVDAAAVAHEQPTTDAGAVAHEQPTTDAGAVAHEQPTTDAGAVVAGEAGAASPSDDDGERAEAAEHAPRFRERTRMRRRVRYLRRLRELAFRDLGGLVFDLHRFGRDRGDLVAQKLEALASIDREMRTLETALRERRDFTDLHEAGIAACPRCGTLHDTDANFCPGCGTSLTGGGAGAASPVVVADGGDATPGQPADAPAAEQPTAARP